MVFQSYALYPTMTVRENITFGMESRGVPKPEQDAAVARVAALLQIEPLLNRKPGQLSGGQRQRVAMGRALVRDPAAVPVRRAALQPRRQAARRDAHRDQEAAPARRQDHRLRHPRPGRGDDARLAHRRHAPGRACSSSPSRATSTSRPANIFVAGFMGSPAMNFIPAETGRARRRRRRRGPARRRRARPRCRCRSGRGRRGRRRRRWSSASGPEHIYRYDRGPATRASRGIAPLRRRSRWSSRPAPRPSPSCASASREVVGRFDPDERAAHGREA